PKFFERGGKYIDTKKDEENWSSQPVNRRHNCTEHAKNNGQKKMTAVPPALEIEQRKKQCNRATDNNGQQIQSAYASKSSHDQVGEPFISDPGFAGKGIREEIRVWY